MHLCYIAEKHREIVLQLTKKIKMAFLTKKVNFNNPVQSQLQTFFIVG